MGRAVLKDQRIEMRYLSVSGRTRYTIYCAANLEGVRQGLTQVRREMQDIYHVLPF